MRASLLPSRIHATMRFKLASTVCTHSWCQKIVDGARAWDLPFRVLDAKSHDSRMHYAEPVLPTRIIIAAVAELDLASWILPAGRYGNKKSATAEKNAELNS